MSMKLFISAILKFLLGVLLVGVLVFLPAGTLDYVNGWILMAVLFVPMFIAGIVMMVKNPNLLAKRLDAKEEEKTQSMVVKLSGLMFIGGFVLAGLDYRFCWLKLPFTVFTMLFSSFNPNTHIGILLSLAKIDAVISTT